jgi:hypothetical protein
MEGKALELLLNFLQNIKNNFKTTALGINKMSI